MAGHEPSDNGGTDWRRFASDRNVSHDVARALWEQARAAAPDDPVQAEHAFHLMLDEAEAANITQEPGRETLANSTPSARDASALGPGKWTRVLLEQPKPAGSIQRGAETAKPSAERLRNELAAAGQAGKAAAELLAASDSATIVEALRELTARQGPGALQKIMSVAGGAVERILSQRSAPSQAGSPVSSQAGSPVSSQVPSPAPPAQTGPAAASAASAASAVRSTNGNQVTQGTPERAPAAPAAPADRKR